LYNGEEIGMTDLLLTDLSQFRDLLGVWAYEMETEILGVSPEEAVIHAATYGRDKCRTPLQWRNAPNGGFSPPGIETWLPINPNYAKGVNVEDQEADPVSLLTFYKRMLSLRKNSPALIAGEYFPLNEDAPDYLSFLRHSTEQDCLVVLNYSASSHALRFDALEALLEGLERPAARLLFSSHDRAGKSEELNRLEIAPYEIYIAELVGDG
jgi:alpha-glucosidase